MFIDPDPDYYNMFTLPPFCAPVTSSSSFLGLLRPLDLREGSHKRWATATTRKRKQPQRHHL